MSRRGVLFPAKDAPLRDDVRRLGALVGEMLAEQGGRELFEQVEEVRQAAIRRRRRGGEDGGGLADRLAGLEPRVAAELGRAFAAYFQVVNLAEKVHRIRRRRAHQRRGRPQSDGLEEAARRLVAADLGARRLAELLNRLSLEPVFTAHPSEATRRTILEKEQRIARRLIERLDPSLTPPEKRVLWARIRAEVTASWQTEEHPELRPSVGEELEQVLFYLSGVIYAVVPMLYETLEGALDEAFGEAAAGLRLPTLLRFASWVGGDMDGNPNVTADTYRATLARHRRVILALYDRELGDLAGRLSQGRSRAAVDAAVERRLAEYGERFPAAREAVPERHRDMPYRVLLHLMRARLEATVCDEAAGYREADGLSRDLELIAASLARHRGRQAGLFRVQRLLRKVDCFGFHLARVDLRQDALVHRAAAGRLLGEADWLSLTAAERQRRLARALDTGERPAVDPGDEDRRVLAVFETVADCRRRYGGAAIGPLVISMAEGADDVLTVLLLARWAGLEQDGRVPLDVAPLFETVGDLRAAPEVLGELLGDARYRRHLETRRHRQMVMVGYSDSGKDGGLAASRWALHRAQESMAAVLDEAGVELTVFHGRGGTISRGGGKTHRAILAAPPSAVRGRLRLTEQGETIDANYGLRAIALRHLERAAAATLLATALPAEGPAGAWAEVMDEIARDSRDAYRGLVYADGFEGYFRAATPIDVIERMRIGSRPAARRSRRGIENLRAIPWVFAWTQSRHLLPGWYGLGTALAEARQRHGAQLLAEMAGGWPFFAALLEDVEMVLAKADLAIAARYAGLAGEAGSATFAAIREEFERTVVELGRITGSEALLERDPALRRSIVLRNPYVDPMSLLQVDLLARWRAGGRRDDELLRALLVTVHGIARGLQNTG